MNFDLDIHLWFFERNNVFHLDILGSNFLSLPQSLAFHFSSQDELLSQTFVFLIKFHFSLSFSFKHLRKRSIDNEVKLVIVRSFLLFTFNNEQTQNTNIVKLL